MATIANTKYFRPGTKLPIEVVNILYNFGGLGDFICRIPATRKLIVENSHVMVKVWVPDYFFDLAKNFLCDLNCKVLVSDLFVDRYNRGEIIIDFESRLFKPFGINLMRFAHELLLSEECTDEDLYYPKFNEKKQLIKKYKLPQKYIVITTAATAPARAMLNEAIQGITDYVKSIGYAPVFLGRNELQGNYRALFPKDFDYTQGFDLRNKTTILEAANILAGARLVVGTDNGLLHLANCTTTDTVMGFTTVKPEHRICHRDYGKIIVVEQKEKLNCRYCQSNMKILTRHDRKFCLYKDYLCCRDLTAERYIEAINLLLCNQPIGHKEFQGPVREVKPRPRLLGTPVGI